ncbi:U-box domain-containing protein 11 [Morus notabilis]|uniref:RING-type E3 ubiquitin transferase n=1 Tax=Morus notabilis TaxID=981085 RepID=W9RS70_9ROSA|nr:U-box domain-containing protein 11 [Morus notabilis]EXC06053.1 U-box domain-containing protein 11 [Morus notabilis]
MAVELSGDGADRMPELLKLANDVVAVSIGGGPFKKDCTDLVRRIALLTHLFEEMRDFKGQSSPSDASASSSSSFPRSSWPSDLMVALQAAKCLLLVAANFNSSNAPTDGATKKIAFQFQCVTWKLEKALANLPYDHFDISEEVQEQVELVRAQLRRATERYGSMNSKKMLSHLSQPMEKEIHVESEKRINNLHSEHRGSNDDKVAAKMDGVLRSDSLESHSGDETSHKSEIRRISSTPELYSTNDPDDDDNNEQENPNKKGPVEKKKSDVIVIPDDYLCPISLELMRDPVIVSTGQTYERSYIQRWIDCGNKTCPKTQQKLENLTLTPNYVLRSLISQWCLKHNIEQPMGLTNGKMKRSDGSFRDVSGDMAAIEALVHKLSSRCIEERRAAATEIRSLSKRSTDNRILIAEAGAIPILVNLLTSDDVLTQENAVTSILNLSIYEDNKGLIMLAGAIPSIVQVLRAGSMEARENAAATLFSLSLADENKIIIGASGAIPALVDLLQNGSTRGKKDAATALFNLCIYQGNKGRAVRAGVITALLSILTDSGDSMVDEALTIMSVLASHQEAKVAIVKAGTIPVLIDLLRTGLPRNKENAAAILLALCKRDGENLACISRLGAVIPLTELAKSGTERGKRKATSLLEHLRKLQLL